jgi:hypothetical protein
VTQIRTLALWALASSTFVTFADCGSVMRSIHKWEGRVAPARPG